MTTATQPTTPTTRTGRIVERGNGLRSEYACDEHGDLYRVVSTHGPIETSGRAGNWLRAELAPADWTALDEGAEPTLRAELGEF